MKSMDNAISPSDARRSSRPATTLTLVEIAHEHLLSMLLSMQIAPGERIRIDAVARLLGISQTPIREALRRLEAENLVHKVTNVGYRASFPMSAREVDDLYTLRALIEPYAAAQAARAMTDGDVRTLAELGEGHGGGEVRHGRRLCAFCRGGCGAPSADRGGQRQPADRRDDPSGCMSIFTSSRSCSTPMLRPRARPLRPRAPTRRRRPGRSIRASSAPCWIVIRTRRRRRCAIISNDPRSGSKTPCGARAEDPAAPGQGPEPAHKPETPAERGITSIKAISLSATCDLREDVMRASKIGLCVSAGLAGLLLASPSVLAQGQRPTPVLGWSPKPDVPTPWKAPNRPHWKLSEVLAKHTGQSDWRRADRPRSGFQRHLYLHGSRQEDQDHLLRR